MARYTGPRTKKSRRYGVALFGPHKALERRNYPPGMHGDKGRRKQSEYATALGEKQKLRLMYGLLERQFRKYYETALRRRGVTGETMLQLLETRLDNVVFRLGFGNSRRAARQMVNHGHVNVNGKRVTIPSYRVRKGDVVSLRTKARSMIVIRHNLDTLERRVPAWLETAAEGAEVSVLDLPQREHIDVPVRESLIVELYSK